MNTMVLGFGGSGLLLSSVVTLILLLRMGYLKDILKSPLHILPVSDTLISIITSIILLANQSTSMTNFDRTSPIAGASEIGNRHVLQDRVENTYSENQTCTRFYRRTNDSGLDSEDLSNCTFEKVLMHYAMFLIPFANAFMSLLIYSVQCSRGMSCVDKKCSSVTKVARLNLRERISETREDLNIISKDPAVAENTAEMSLAISNGENLSKKWINDPEFTGLGLIMQWLVPLLVTAILYLSKTQDSNSLHELTDMECVFKVNFPLESCYKSELVILHGGGRNVSQFALEAGVSDTVRISYPDSKAIDEVVSRVQNVVRSAINKSCGNNSSELKYDNGFRPWNVTKYVTLNNLTQQVASDDDEGLEKLSDIQKVLNDKDLQIFENKECETSEDEEWKFFEDVVESTRSRNNSASSLITEQIVPEDFTPQETLTPMKIFSIDKTEEITEESTGETTDEMNDRNETVIIKTVGNTTPRLKDRMYANIIQRIRNTVTQVRVKGQLENSGIIYKVDDKNSTNSKDGVLPGVDTGKLRMRSKRNFYDQYKDERVSRMQFETMTECFLSTKFLKIHLSILLFIIYFIPVFISGILQTRAVYMCKNVIEKIENADKRQDFKNPTATTIDETPPSTSGWFSDPKKPQQTDKQIQEPETEFKNILNETKNLQTLFNVLAKSLTLGIIMWTPAFLEVLSKVFLCASTPSWLVNALYLMGVSFGIVKNFFNVNIAKINKNINDHVYRKVNSVHPNV